MRAFNLDEALAGKPVVTRDGRPVKIAGYNPKADLCIVGWVENDAFSWLKDGISAYGKGEYCLFMAPTECKEWVVKAYHNSIAVQGKKFVQLHGPFQSKKDAIKFCSTVELSSIHEITITE